MEHQLPPLQHVLFSTFLIVYDSNFTQSGLKLDQRPLPPRHTCGSKIWKISPSDGIQSHFVTRDSRPFLLMRKFNCQDNYLPFTSCLEEENKKIKKFPFDLSEVKKMTKQYLNYLISR